MTAISTKVWYRVGIELATPGSAVRHASVARHVTDACLTAEPTRCDKAYTGDNPHLMHQSFVSTAPLMHQSFVSTAPSPTGPISTWISVFFSQLLFWIQIKITAKVVSRLGRFQHQYESSLVALFCPASPWNDTCDHLTINIHEKCVDSATRRQHGWAQRGWGQRSRPPGKSQAIGFHRNTH